MNEMEFSFPEELQMPEGVHVRAYGLLDAKVYLMEDFQCVSMQAMKHLIGLLPQWRKEKVQAMKNERARRECVFAFILLMVALRRDYDIRDELEFSYNEHGKPQLVNHEDIHFNISHCGEAIACVTGNSPVGIDVERRGRYKETLARHILNETEWADVQNSVDKDLSFTILWTKKEAMLKKTGTGISGGMKHVLDECLEDDITTYVEGTYVCSIAT